MPPRRAPRVPLQPLVDATGSTSIIELALLIGVNSKAVYRAQSEGLSELVADRWATRAGLHPMFDVWGEAYRAICPEPEFEDGGLFCGRREDRGWHGRDPDDPRWARWAA